MRFPRAIGRLFRRVGRGLAGKGLPMARTAILKAIPQSGVIPYRWRGGRLQVLLITSRRSGEWVVPKGQLEPDMTPHDSAAKEAVEEAGVVGRVGDASLGAFEYEKWGGLHAVEVFELEVTRELSEWPEKGERSRKWVYAEEAPGLVKHEGLGDIISRLARRLSRTRRA